jgi:hypothetical protein
MATALIADAQAMRTWVSGVGADDNPCSRTAPCKTFAGAISKTATNGEINCLDPGGYGAVTITKSVTIDCEDTQGSILASSGNGVVVNITAVTDTKKSFKLRGVSINGDATGTNGVRVLSANQVILEEVVIDGMSQHGVSFENTSGTTKATIDHCALRSNAGNGINTFILGGNLQLAVANTTLTANATGFNLSSGTKAALTNCVVNGNTNGVAAFTADLTIAFCTILNNSGTGVSASTSANIRLTNSVVTSNGTGLSFSGGTLVSFTSNMLQGNTIAGAPSSTVGLQ